MPIHTKIHVTTKIATIHIIISLPLFNLVLTHAVPYGNHGCNSGTVQKAYQYVISVGGVDTADSYPYSNKVSLA